jgi:hypothetical protein
MMVVRMVRRMMVRALCFLDEGDEEDEGEDKGDIEGAGVVAGALKMRARSLTGSQEGPPMRGYPRPLFEGSAKSDASSGSSYQYVTANFQRYE